MTSIDEWLRWAADCAASGNVEGEVEGYRRADELGDAEAAVLLGNALRRGGHEEAAIAAYSRGEARGHPEAAMSLGNLLSDRGDIEGAKAAYLRSIERGSAIASLNLGLLLAEAGDGEGALPYLRRAAEAGDPRGFWGQGKIHESLEQWELAADSYRAGAEWSDPHCAYGLGVCLLQLGDTDDARAAFERARELGHEGAADALAILDQGDGLPQHGPDVRTLWSNVTAIYEVFAAQRRELGRQWIAASMVVQEKRKQLEALRRGEADVRQSLDIVVGRFNAKPVHGEPQFYSLPTPVPACTAGAWLDRAPDSIGWALSEVQDRAFQADLAEARQCFTQAQGKTFGGGLRHRANSALDRVRARLDALNQVISVAAHELAEAETSRRVDAQDQAERSKKTLEPVQSLMEASAAALPRILQPWSSPVWGGWTSDDTESLGLRLAYGGMLVPQSDPQLGDNQKFGTDLRIPYGFPLHESWLIHHETAFRTAAHGFVRSLMLRHLLSAAPGEVRFLVFDPTGLGQSAGDLLDLSEYDPDLIGGKVWSSPRDLEARLAELSDHIELVIQKYLRTTYETIDEFNDAAGEVAEPYRILVLFDVPTGLTAESATLLRSVLQNGPRCGVFTLMACDPSAPAPYGVDLAQLSDAAPKRMNLQAPFKDEIGGYELTTVLDHEVLPERSEVARTLIDGIGRAAIRRTEGAVTFEKTFSLFRNVAARGLQPELGSGPLATDVSDAATWWRSDSTAGLFAPIGQKGARDVAVLGLDSANRFGALLVGRPGAGKSTLLHTYIGGLTTLYSPEELQLYLIDFKEGVEFKAYAEEKLPHAKVIAIESDREFGLSVLESLNAEIVQRAEMLRATGGRQAGLQSLRESTGETIPRILLVFDEFQVLFARNDKVGLAAADLLETIIRQGRGFGIHVLLGSQSLSGLDALGAHVPQLLPVRILLPAAEADARRVLGEGNSAGDYLTNHGEGILNPSGGAVEANERFKGALLAESDRIARLQSMREKANNAGFTRAPMVFEGNALTPLGDEDPLRFREELTASGSYPIRIRAGAPMAVGDVGDLVLSREAGANVLAVMRNGATDVADIDPAGGPAYGLLCAAVMSGVMANATVDVIDFMPNDDGLDELFEPLLNTRSITLKRRRAFPEVVKQHLEEVRQRVELEENGGSPKLLVLFGVHRARELNSEIGSLDADHDLMEQLEELVREGPEYGVHVWMWAESVSGASRRLTPRIMREVGWRIAGKMSGDDSQTFIGGSQAADLRESQLLILHDDRGAVTRVMGYSPPPSAWISQILSKDPRVGE